MRNTSGKATLLIAMILLAAVFGPFHAHAEVSGFEQLLNVTVDCPEDLGPAASETIGKYAICPYRMIKCKLKESGKVVFTGFVTIDCEKPSDSPCPKIGQCATLKMRPEVAEAVRQSNDPNNDSNREDGANDPLEKEKHHLDKGVSN